MKKQYIESPLPMSCGFLRHWLNLIAGVLLAPVYLAMAWIAGAPGIGVHLRCAAIGARLLITGKISLKRFYRYIFYPLDSTRYFEFHEVLKSLAEVLFHRYLDVSSPRMVPIMLMMRNKTATAELVNPDAREHKGINRLINGLGLTSRCRLTDHKIEATEFSPGTFDVITCISVLEHIPSDKAAVEKMWSLLCSGGRLILTVPCKAKPLEQYINGNAYGVLSPGEDGYTFWQRFYDEERLRDVIYNTTGQPVRKVVYGEKSYGLFYRNSSMKRLLGRSLYPFWREPYMMAAEYKYFNTVDELPGEGVILLEFIKP